MLITLNFPSNTLTAFREANSLAYKKKITGVVVVLLGSNTEYPDGSGFQRLNLRNQKQLESSTAKQTLQ